MCTNSHDRLASETWEEREARLQQVRDRLAFETTEEAGQAIQQMSVHQTGIGDITEEREASPSRCMIDKHP